MSANLHFGQERVSQWGFCEYAFATAIFCLPAMVALAGGNISHAFFAIGAALILTLAARGVSGGQRFLAAGVLASCVWYFGGGIVGISDSLDAYVWLLPLALVAHYNLVPFAMRRALRQPSARRPMIALGASVILMNMTPAVFLLTRWLAGTKSSFVAAFLWLMAMIASAGAFATIVSARMQPKPETAGETSP